ncbi:MAG: Flp pilus assembly complex ATPase component TadA [Mailhella sp.]|nr:Flp pilus assembly complex ATPase component TadA [Mailhella sp.]
MADYTPTIPDALAGRIRYQDSRFHASQELKGNLILDALFAEYTEKTGASIIPCEWYSPADYEQSFGIRYAHDGLNIGAAGEQSWVDRLLYDLLTRALEKKATDIHVSYMGPYTQINFRRLGRVIPEMTLNGEEGIQFIRGIFQGQYSHAESGFTEHERYDGRIADHKFLPPDLFVVRLHTEPLESPHIYEPGVSLSMRLFYDTTSATGTLKERLGSLGYTPEQQNLIHGFTERSGLTLISGPTGSGKTTTLKNILEALTQYVPTKNYYSLEDPPEYTLLGVKQLKVFTKAASDAERLSALLNALAGLMRSDPDVIMLGEIRYEEAASAAIQAALTGHSVYSTVHASSAIGIIARLHEMGIPLESICTDRVLNGLIYQRLIPHLCPECKQKLTDNLKLLSPELTARLKKIYRGNLDGIFIKGKGCPHCLDMGLVGQQVAAETISCADRKLISYFRENKLYEAQRYWMNECGGKTHVEQALERISSGLVDPIIAEERLGVTLDHDFAYREA